MIASVVLERGDADQIAARAAAIYRERYQDDCEAHHTGKFVAIDIDTERAFVCASMREAAARGRDASPHSLLFFKKVGETAAIHTR
jgi:hypothetical protein